MMDNKLKQPKRQRSESCILNMIHVGTLASLDCISEGEHSPDMKTHEGKRKVYPMNFSDVLENSIFQKLQNYIFIIITQLILNKRLVTLVL